MSKKMMRALSATSLALLMGSMTVACGGGGGGIGGGGIGGGGGGNHENEDPDTSHLYVQTYDGGPGSAWLDEAIKRFEEANKTTVYETGRTGVKVHLTADKTTGASSLKNSGQQVWFFNNIYYNNYIAQGDFLKISDMVKETLPEGKTIESKLSADNKAALTAYDGDYYCLPTHQCLGGITYNRYMFDTEGFYLLDDATQGSVKDANDARYGFMTVKADRTLKKSCGPDALYGTDDDGLPSSVEEFKRLCDCMVAKNVTPFVCYASSGHYTQNLLYALWANLSGYDEAMLSISFDSQTHGTADLATIDASGNITVQENQTINAENGYKMYSQASRAYALDFMQYVFNKNKVSTYLTKDSVQSSLSHTGAQYDFLRGENANGDRVGMLLEGSYWENESKEADRFGALKNNYPDAYNNLDYRFMPMPVQYNGRVASRGTVGEAGVTEADGIKQVGLDTLYYYCFINKHAVENNPVAEQIAKDFIKFCYSDESLRINNVMTSLTLGVEYELTAEQEAQLSPYAKSLYNIKKNGQIITPVSDSPIFVKNMSSFTTTTLGSEVWANDLNEIYPFRAFKDKNRSVKEMFDSIASYHDADWWSKLNK